ncbi:carboxymuconolactone decarboxylase family protein [Caulobacter sp. BK020]|uniref:carboxymuconolactone decarboxylase family protein n=1 Tax=Caulobacter sp. BK020 TaxID=2512117 RepID=UPI001051F410|nr:carboxymuconolactone decarboxylase family protein [Caulobacter sp. BK020]TCS16811.1 AhpD family alkylhydroperoxidase [Caulobacter sp. BK020]HWU13223.1 carboxymuconolactone decarboxylase family protein [Caulobacter sp.]HWW26740.1 carboxymuconolactone decarboxylase family protein [Caulobacter sp.]
MQARMTQPAMLIPDAYKAMMALSKAAQVDSLPEHIHELVHLRVSQINGCGVCVDMHGRMAKKAGETDQRLFSVAAWRDTPFFTDAERAALDLAEVVTRIADKGDAVPDAVWDEAARHYDEKALAGLLLTISAINVWNRLNAATRQVAGTLGV